jgi:plasmid stabilization system protein ParE
MHKKVIWSPLAERDFVKILDYLNENWDRIVANHFTDLIEEILEQISINPRQFPVVFKKEKVRKCVLTKHNSLFYRDSKSQIEILRIFDTRQHPDMLTF